MAKTPSPYKDTVILPKTDFPMKADLPKREPEMQKRWDAEDLYGKIRQARKGKTKYILHDGPPYANGDVHIGTGLNKILKDIVVKYKTLRGFDAPYVPGWDCHGLPIEHNVMKGLGDKARTLDKAAIRGLCETYARKYIDVQRTQFKALGVFGDWFKPYLTLDPQYEKAALEVFADLVERGHIYRAKRSIHWCMECRTALAEAELEYKDATGPSIYCGFPVTSDLAGPFGVPPGMCFNVDQRLMIWTTTPWTLPANVAVAVHPKLEYALVEYRDGGKDPRYTVLAAPLVEKLAPLLGLKDAQIMAKTPGADLEGLRYELPYSKAGGKVVLADYVRLDDGTGLVHTAPGHGREDFETGRKYGLPILCPVDAAGAFTDEAGSWKGRNVFAADLAIIEDLRSRGVLFQSGTVGHSYPHCWRCKKPVIFRATEQWFIAVDHAEARQKALGEIKKTKWFPATGEARISAMLQDRPDWCISRQRTWGVPIPALYCEGCQKPLLDPKVLRHIAGLFGRHGATYWFTADANNLLPAGTKCPSCSAAGPFRKEDDIFDVWFESGASHRAVCMAHPELGFPADLYLEGSDQHRGWFQLSLLPSVMTQGKAPFKAVLTHGFVVDEEGEKLSKSKQAGKDAKDTKESRGESLMKADAAMKNFGADVLRLWAASSNFTNDIPVSLKIIEERGEAYRKIRNTFRYLLGNLADFDPAKNAVADEKKLREMDRWMLHRFSALVRTVTEAYDVFEFHRVVQALHNFCVVDLSAVYLDVLKDRLYCNAANSADRRSAQTVLHEIARGLAVMFTPILAHTAEEVWQMLPGRPAGSVHVAQWPAPAVTPDEALDKRWGDLLLMRAVVAVELEKRRAEKAIGSNVDAHVTIECAPTVAAQLKSFGPDLEAFLIVSGVAVKEAAGAPSSEGATAPVVRVEKSPLPECDRCWQHKATVGKDKEHPLLCERCVGVVQGLKARGPG